MCHEAWQRRSQDAVQEAWLRDLRQRRREASPLRAAEPREPDDEPEIAFEAVGAGASEG